MLKKIEDKLNSIGIFEIDDSEFEYSENPKHLKVGFYIDTKYEFITNKNNLLINYLQDEGRLDILYVIEYDTDYPFCKFIYEDNKFYTTGDMNDTTTFLLYKSFEYAVKPIFDSFFN